MFFAFCIFAVLFFFGILAENYLNHGEIIDGDEIVLQNYVRRIKPEGWARVTIPALIVGAVHYLVPKVVEYSWLEWIFFLSVLVVIMFYLYEFVCDADRFRELVVFMPLFLVPCITLNKIAKILAEGISNDFGRSLVHPVIPNLVLLLAAGIPIVVCFWRCKIKIIAAVLAFVIACGTICTVANADWSFLDSPDNISMTQETTTTTATTTEADDSWAHFFNGDLQDNGDKSDDFNFGTNPVHESWTAADYDNDFRDRLAKDPALGAADMAWLDANVGTRFLGEFYESCKHDWAKTINLAKEKWLKDESSYFETLDAFFEYLDHADVRVVERGKNIKDQMYMNPYTTNGIPDVIVLKTDQNDGPFLVYVFKIKGNTFEVEYRIPCGYQPTNVEDVMHITPTKKPSTPRRFVPTTTRRREETTTTKPHKETTTKPHKETTTKPHKETTTKKYKKDPKKSHNSGQNDDKGPGEDTNTGGNESSKDKDTNSNHLPSYDDYKDKMKELSEANTTTESTTKPKSNVDDNGKEANKPTPTKNKPEEVVTDKPAKEWNGPSDD